MLAGGVGFLLAGDHEGRVYRFILNKASTTVEDGSGISAKYTTRIKRV
jgi:hypothetical protein